MSNDITCIIPSVLRHVNSKTEKGGIGEGGVVHRGGKGGLYLLSLFDERFAVFFEFPFC